MFVADDFNHDDPYLSNDFANAESESDVTDAWKYIILFDIDGASETDRLGNLLSEESLVGGVVSYASEGTPDASVFKGIKITTKTASGMQKEKIISVEDSVKYGIIESIEKKSLVIVLSLMPSIINENNGANVILKTELIIKDGENESLKDVSKRVNPYILKMFGLTQDYSSSLIASIHNERRDSFDDAYLIMDMQVLDAVSVSAVNNLQTALKRMVDNVSKSGGILDNTDNQLMVRFNEKMASVIPGYTDIDIADEDIIDRLMTASENILGLLDVEQLSQDFTNKSEELLTENSNRLTQITALEELII